MLINDNKAINKSKLRNPFGVVEGVLMHISEIDRNMSVKCPYCGNGLLLRNGEKNVKHLYHKANFSCNSESESFIHKCIKDYLFERLNYLNLSNHKIIIQSGKYMLSGCERLGVKEKYKEYLGLSDNYRPDIFLRLEGNYNVSIEVCYKSKKNVNELKKILNSTNINMVIEVAVDEEDLINMSVNSLLRKSKIIYNPIEEDFLKIRNSVVSKLKQANELISNQKEIHNYKKLYRNEKANNVKLRAVNGILNGQLDVNKKEIYDLKCKLEEKYYKQTYRMKYEEELNRNKLLFDLINNQGEIQGKSFDCKDAGTAINALNELNEVYISRKKKTNNYLELLRDLAQKNNPDDFTMQVKLRDIGKIQDSLDSEKLYNELKKVLKV